MGERADRPARRVVVGLLTDPDLPELIALSVADSMPVLLAERVSDSVEWVVEPVRDPFEARNPEVEYLIDKARARVRHTEWDLAVCLTDLPVRSGRHVLVANVSGRDRVAWVSLPALGGLRLPRRFADLAVDLIGYLLTADPARDRTLTGPRLGTPRLLAGMIRANRPWKLVLGLSGALAGALTGATFGVLYSTIWQLATALAPPRLAAVTSGAVVMLVGWLVFGHGLWERRPPLGGATGDTALCNLATLLTVLFGALVFFAVLFAFTATAVAVVVPPGYLAATVGHPVGWVDYVRLALMAAVLGTVAGAVGSGLEDDQTVRRAAFGHRQRERRHWVEQREAAGGHLQRDRS